MITPQLYLAYPDFVVSLIKILACHENWEIREEAASVIKRLNQEHFDDLLGVYNRWAKDKNPFLKRAISVGLIKPFPKEKDRLDKIFKLFEEIMQCDDAYVKKNCGPFGLAAVFCRYPVETEKQLLYWLDKYAGQPTVVWNVITVFSQANAKYLPEYGEKILKAVKQKGLLERHLNYKEPTKAFSKSWLVKSRMSFYYKSGFTR